MVVIVVWYHCDLKDIYIFTSIIFTVILIDTQIIFGLWEPL